MLCLVISLTCASPNIISFLVLRSPGTRRGLSIAVWALVSASKQKHWDRLKQPVKIAMRTKGLLLQRSPQPLWLAPPISSSSLLGSIRLVGDQVKLAANNERGSHEDRPYRSVVGFEPLYVTIYFGEPTNTDE